MKNIVGVVAVAALVLIALALSLLLTPDVASAKTWRDMPSSVIPRALKQSSAPRRGTMQHRAWVACRVWKRGERSWRGKCKQMIKVAFCEGSLDPRSKNGQYLGSWQVSKNLRRDYSGFGRGMWRQARHAKKVWRASGRNWRVHWRWSASCWAA